MAAALRACLEEESEARRTTKALAQKMFAPSESTAAASAAAAAVDAVSEAGVAEAEIAVGRTSPEAVTGRGVSSGPRRRWDRARLTRLARLMVRAWGHDAVMAVAVLVIAVAAAVVVAAALERTGHFVARR